MTDDLVQRLRIRPLSVLVNPNSMCSEAADRIEAQAAEIERLQKAIKVQASAARALHHNEETEINQLRKIRAEAHRAVATLDSERDMNALLTEEIEALTAEVERLRGVLLWIRGVCAEELDLEYTDAMRRAFQRNVRDAALNALTTPEVGQPWLRTYDEHLKGKPNDD